MSIQTKKSQTRVNQLITKASYIIMAGAATFGMVESPGHLNSRIVVPNQPSFAWANVNLQNEDQNNSIRRERDDVEPHYISYSNFQRTASRAGKHK